ncbi:MAG TPA: hypothetical protein VHV83_07230, partial [Armatimonadota bacterium]|nr:hypothetical protein [Armatimonadota bacterium]
TVSRQPATTQTTKSAPHLTWEEPAGNPDGHTLIAQYVDTMAMCVTQSDHPRETISCAILPVTTPDDKDLHIADTLTAALVCAFQDRQVSIDLHRLPPSMPTAEQPSAATLAQLAQTVSDKYVITGSLERSETGYLLSLYAYDRQTAQLVFDGAHPILLPPDVLPTDDHADSVGS